MVQMLIALLVLPGLAIAGWLAFLFISKRRYETGVVVFLTTALVPITVWYVAKWLSEVFTTFLYDRFYDLPPGHLYGTMPTLAQAVTDFLPYFPTLCMVLSFIWLCVHWAKRGQQLEKTHTVSAQEYNKQPRPRSGDKGNAAEGDATVRARLEVLEKLRSDGLITASEYTAKRAEIIASF